MTSLNSFQSQAKTYFDKHGLLSFKKLESWKYTNPSKLFYGMELNSIHNRMPSQKSQSDYPGMSINTIQLVFIDGYLDQTCSDLKAFPKGVKIHDMRDCIHNSPDVLMTYFEQHPIDYHDHPMVAMNHSNVAGGIWIEVDQDVVLERPVHIIYQSESSIDNGITHYCNLITLRPNSQVTVIEDAQANPQQHQILNTVTSIECGEGAKLEYFTCQRKTTHLSYIANLQLWQQKDSDVYAFNTVHGGKVGRFDIHSRLLQPGAKCMLDGIFQLSGQSHTDNHILVEHLASSTVSDVCYKGLVSDQSHGVWNAKAIVHKGIKQINVQQSNKNLLLSKQAIIDTKPELEIYADDLKCSHGATVGQLDEQELFYLQSRGIPKQKAKAILTTAFCAQAIKRIPNKTLRDWVDSVA